MAALLRLGHDGLVANGRRLASRLDTLTVSEARDVLEACGLAAERHARAMTRACEKDPEGIPEREARERALCPAVTARLTGTYHAIPWDARHDGHLASREVSRAAGLVRWAHALTSERSSRVHLAVGRSLSLRTRCCRRLEAPSSARLHRPHQRLHSEARHRLLDRRSADCRRLCGQQRPRDESVRRVGDSARRRYARLSACAPCRRQDALPDRTPPRRLYR